MLKMGDELFVFDSWKILVIEYNVKLFVCIIVVVKWGIVSELEVKENGLF